MRELDYLDLACVVRRLPHCVRSQMKERGAAIFVAGGFIRACVAGEEVSDVDMFCASKDAGKIMATEVCAKVKGRFVETDNAFSVYWAGLPAQYIHRWTFSSPDKCIEAFDFTIAKAAVWFDSETKAWRSACHDAFYSDLAAKRLVYTFPDRNEDAGGSMIRVLKFYQRGYRIPLDSLGGVVARLIKGVNVEGKDSAILWCEDEKWRAKILTGLLREVDPNSNPDRYLVDTSPAPADESAATQ